ncbi:hypothetical protein SDC9_81951 [bioreactor metagenome]|uniref:Uncharacterized protein n=1 Tax=bioreactor metagenome TaxID=1076179 RepID=A0A644Z3A0_9ZZZZ
MPFEERFDESIKLPKPEHFVNHADIGIVSKSFKGKRGGIDLRDGRTSHGSGGRRRGG